MKNLIIKLSLISTLLIGHSALAKDEITSVIEPITIETIVVTAKPEVANFEIYSLDITEKAINSAMYLMLDDLSNSIPNNNVLLVNTFANIDQSI